MKIAIDASRTTTERITGTEHYARQLIRALIALDSDHEFTLYFRDPPPQDLFPASPRVKYKVIPLPRVWTHARFASVLWRDRPDVTFVPAHTLPFAFPGRAVVTVHDLGYKYFPEAHPHASRLYLDVTTRYSAKRANAILADSQATASDLNKFYGTPPEKIHVVYPGVSAPLVVNIDTIRAKYQLPENYLLFIGTLQPRKNIFRIVQAFHHYKRRFPQSDLGLVLAGSKGWLYDPAWVEGVDGVTVTGYVDEIYKGALYAGAQALIFPSLYEGFGFPVVEALHCGTPVITSRTSSLPELVGEAGILVDPENVGAIADAIAQVVGYPHISANAMKAQAEKFTWSVAAQAALEVLERVGQSR